MENIDQPTVGIEFLPSNNFRNSYYRSGSRANGQRNIRCFPSCSANHNERTFCGRPVRVTLHLYVKNEDARIYSSDNICCVGEYKPINADYKIRSDATGLELSHAGDIKANNATYFGRVSQSFPHEVRGDRTYIKINFDFNSELRGWSYLCRDGGRIKSSDKHVFAITVFTILGNLYLNLDPISSTYRRIRSNFPGNIGSDFRYHSFHPIAYFDSPVFTISSMKEKTDFSPLPFPSPAAKDDNQNTPQIKPPTVINPIDLPKDLDIDRLPSFLSLPLNCFKGVEFSQEQIEKVIAQEGLTDVDIKSIKEKLSHKDQYSRSVLGEVVSHAPDLYGMSRHDHLLRPEAEEREHLAQHDYIHRLQLLRDIDLDPIRSENNKIEIPFPYPNQDGLRETLLSLLPTPSDSRQLLLDLLSSELVFPVALEPSIILLKSLFSPIRFDPHCFSRAPTGPLLRPPPLDHYFSLQPTSSLLSLPSLPSTGLLSRSATLIDPPSGSFEPLFSVSSQPPTSAPHTSLSQPEREGVEEHEKASFSQQSKSTLLDEPLSSQYVALSTLPCGSAISLRHSSKRSENSEAAFYILRAIADLCPSTCSTVVSTHISDQFEPGSPLLEEQKIVKKRKRLH